MKKLRLVLLFLICNNGLSAQISITTADMPGANDTARLTVAPTPLGLNYQATGANYTWDFSNLRNQSQEVDSFFNVNTTNFIYALYFANLPFNTNRANVATKGTPFPANPLVTITDPYNFYYNSTASYQQVGLGAEFSGIPLPVAYSQKDKVYEFPLNFGDNDTSISSWNIALAGAIYYGYNQTRVNDVDGWGTLITPRGTYNALRVKTTINGADTISLDTLNINLSINRPTSREYKWLVNGEIVPELQITTTEVFGFEIVSSIRFRDDYLTVFPGVQPTAFCAGNTYTLPYIRQGTFNPAGNFQASNSFHAFLSDSNGDFTNAVDIGFVTATQSGNVTVTIPANTPAGTGYRIRFTGTNPAVTGPENGIDIEIFNGVPVASTINANATTFCLGDSAILNGTSVTSATFNWALNGTIINGATTLDLTAFLAGDYTLITGNICGESTSNTITITVDSLPLASNITSSNISFCSGDSAILTGTAISNATYQWTNNGIPISGFTTSDYTAYSSGTYVLQTINNCGTTNSNSIAVTVDSPVTSAIINNNDTLLCFGDSALLVGNVTPGTNYQWTINGNTVNGANSNTIYANQTGIYNLNSFNQCGTALSNDVNVTINPALPVPVITQNGLQLNTIGGYTYQWLFNNTPIAGTDSFLVISSNGDYTVIITDPAGCISSSVVFNATGVGMGEISGDRLAVVYPNPSKGEFNLQLNKLNQDATISIYEISGKLLFSSAYKNQSTSLHFTFNYPAGVYLLEVLSKDRIETFKLVIE